MILYNSPLDVIYFLSVFCYNIVKGYLSMKIIRKENINKNDIEILIEYPKMNKIVSRIEAAIKSVDSIVTCSGENEQTLFIAVSEIFYIESVDKRTFVYTKDKVYRTDSPLYLLAEKLYTFGFEQISKSCVLNINVMTSVRPLFNSKMEALLTNGEKVQISRKFIPVIKKRLEEML